MHVSKRSVCISIGLLALVAGSAAAARHGAEAGRFQPSDQGWASAYNAGDADKIVAMYADDAVLMPPGAPAAKGHAAMRAFLLKDMASSKRDGMTLAIEDGASGSSGDLGWHSGTFSVTDAAGKTAGTGKYVEVWQKRGGKWVLFRDIWNYDAPAAASTAQH